MQTVKPAIYITATPIGNLEDITYRAVRTLKEVDVILCEDTRKTQILCNAYGISTPLKSYRVHHLQADTEYALARLKEGAAVALCTDAGTPGLSDPGSHLVRAVREQLPDVPIYPVPGASAVAAAVSVSGYRANPFIFAGFLSIKPGARKRFFEGLRDFDGLIVFYESVHRIKKVLGEVQEILPERPVFVAREMTKHFEEYRELSPGDTLKEKGEFTVVLGLARKGGEKKDRREGEAE